MATNDYTLPTIEHATVNKKKQHWRRSHYG